MLASQKDFLNILFHTDTSKNSSGLTLTWVRIFLVLIALACSPDVLIPAGPIRSTPPDTRSEPELSSVCSRRSNECVGSTSSPSTNDRYSPVARMMP